MLFLLILLAQGAPATTLKHVWAGGSLDAPAALFEALAKAPLEAVQGRLFDAQAAVTADPGDKKRTK